jgi:hypothetical protein
MARLTSLLTSSALLLACSEVRVKDGTGGATTTSGEGGSSGETLLERYMGACEARRARHGCTNADCTLEEAEAEFAIWGQFPGCFETLIAVLECSATESPNCGICGTDEEAQAWDECGGLLAQSQGQQGGGGTAP